MLDYYEAMTLNMTYIPIFTLEQVRLLTKFSEECTHGK